MDLLRLAKGYSLLAADNGATDRSTNDFNKVMTPNTFTPQCIRFEFM